MTPSPTIAVSLEVLQEIVTDIQYIGCHTEHGKQTEPCPICVAIDRVLANLAPYLTTELQAARRELVSLRKPAEEISEEPCTPDPGQCVCRKCLDGRNVKVWWMLVCCICGNKRCPHASDHAFACTSSNELVQAGVLLPATPPSDLPADSDPQQTRPMSPEFQARVLANPAGPLKRQVEEAAEALLPMRSAPKDGTPIEIRWISMDGPMTDQAHWNGEMWLSMRINRWTGFPFRCHDCTGWRPITLNPPTKS